MTIPYEELRLLLTEELADYYVVEGTHDFNHVEQVYSLAVAIRDNLNLNISDEELLIAAYYHDMFSLSDRVNHHTAAKNYVLTGDSTILNDLDAAMKERIANAVGEHRASYEGEYSSILSEVISAADRGEPNMNAIVVRVYKCALEPDTIHDYPYDNVKPGETPTHKQALDRAYYHIKDKYAANGYARYNDIYRQHFGETLSSMRNALYNLEHGELETIIEQELNLA